MSSRVGMTIIEMIANKIGGKIRKGKTLPVLVGSALGLVLGYAIAWSTEMDNFGYYLGSALLGLLITSLTSASLFPKPPNLPETHDWFGKIASHWILTERSQTSTMYTCYVVMENAIVRLFQNCYTGSSTPDFEEWLGRLERGEMPEATATQVYSLEGLKCLEITSDNRFVTLFCEHGDQVASNTVDCGEASKVKEFINSLETVRHVTFEDSYREMRLGEATLWPWILLGIAIVAVTGIAWLSNYWTLHPPRPPRGKPEGDELVRFLTWAGPRRITLYGLIPIGIAGSWLVKRVFSRPQVRVLSPVIASE